MIFEISTTFLLYKTNIFESAALVCTGYSYLYRLYVRYGAAIAVSVACRILICRRHMTSLTYSLSEATNLEP